MGTNKMRYVAQYRSAIQSTVIYVHLKLGKKGPIKRSTHAHTTKLRLSNTLAIKSSEINTEATDICDRQRWVIMQQHWVYVDVGPIVRIETYREEAAVYLPF